MTKDAASDGRDTVDGGALRRLVEAVVVHAQRLRIASPELTAAIGALLTSSEPASPVRDGAPPRGTLTMGEAAQALNVSERTVRRRVADGSLEHRRLGRRALIPVHAVRNGRERPTWWTAMAGRVTLLPRRARRRDVTDRLKEALEVLGIDEADVHPGVLSTRREAAERRDDGTVNADLEASFRRLGMSESAARVAAVGRPARTTLGRAAERGDTPQRIASERGAVEETVRSIPEGYRQRFGASVVEAERRGVGVHAALAEALRRYRADLEESR